MNSIVLELQNAAMSHSGSVLSLLRKALVVSTKLSINDLRAWAKSEMEGYKTEVPEYRSLTSQVKCLDSVHGWRSVSFESPNTEECQEREAKLRKFEKDLDLQGRLSNVKILNPIVEIEAWITSNEEWIRAFPDEFAREVGLAFPAAYCISPASLAVIPDRVISHILDWSLELEKKGIKGEGMTLTPKGEIQTVTNNFNFYGPHYQNTGQVGAMGDSADARDVSLRNQVGGE